MLLCQQAAQASQTRARRWRVGQVPRSMVLRNTSSDTTPDTTSQTVASRDTLQQNELPMRRREHDPEHLICGRRRREIRSISIEGHLKRRHVRPSAILASWRCTKAHIHYNVMYYSISNKKCILRCKRRCNDAINIVGLRYLSATRRILFEEADTEGSHEATCNTNERTRLSQGGNDRG